MIRGVAPKWPDYGRITWRDRLFDVWNGFLFGITISGLYALAYLGFAVAIAASLSLVR